MKIYHELLHSPREIPDAVLLKRVTISFGCQHGLRLTKKNNLVRYYNTLLVLMAHRGGDGSTGRKRPNALTPQNKAIV